MIRNADAPTPSPTSDRRRRFLFAGAAAVALPGVMAQDRWPNKPVKMIIPFPPGQATDIYGRVFAERLFRKPTAQPSNKRCNDA